MRKNARIVSVYRSRVRVMPPKKRPMIESSSPGPSRKGRPSTSAATTTQRGRPSGSGRSVSAAPTAKKPRAARSKSAHKEPTPKKKTVPKKKAARATKEKDFEVFIGRGKNLFSYKKNYSEQWVEWRNTRYQLTQAVRDRFAQNPETRDLLKRYDEAWAKTEPVSLSLPGNGTLVAKDITDPTAPVHYDVDMISISPRGVVEIKWRTYPRRMVTVGEDQEEDEEEDDEEEEEVGDNGEVIDEVIDTADEEKLLEQIEDQKKELEEAEMKIREREERLNQMEENERMLMERNEELRKRLEEAEMRIREQAAHQNKEPEEEENGDSRKLLDDAEKKINDQEERLQQMEADKEIMMEHNEDLRQKLEEANETIERQSEFFNNNQREVLDNTREILRRLGVERPNVGEIDRNPEAMEIDAGNVEEEGDEAGAARHNDAANQQQREALRQILDDFTAGRPREDAQDQRNNGHNEEGDDSANREEDEAEHQVHAPNRHQRRQEHRDSSHSSNEEAGDAKDEDEEAPEIEDAGAPAIKDAEAMERSVSPRDRSQSTRRHRRVSGSPPNRNGRVERRERGRAREPRLNSINAERRNVVNEPVNMPPDVEELWTEPYDSPIYEPNEDVHMGLEWFVWSY
ncbi:hypothetical protein CAEBREN_00411 [Caenorhabditis brenneri]|uniref:Uncharacterized protein n=1 Tax=Caenorhabditis brenneri TaxID=135651 RepID=G0MYB4_CAEBE|nr:hypothetical protein CAEBREN_00411 [Caenorhabditis brenneri]